ncbi:xanthine dehydrogenase [Candidatus Vecturithrix granuli]|uniref:Xanthine dehydrogenase n=1 Tax=Vecturithrix granuli TaxID=1499967 RepID=A0A081CA75_VECG1|nr:xanthine dehydrogenase [Candidatus Vecturithrix granuli]
MSDEYSIVWTELGIEPRAELFEGKDLNYVAPTTLAEAEQLKQSAKGYHYLAGGTILNWKGSPRVKGLIDLKHLQLEKITGISTEIRIGAMATIQYLADCPALPQALRNSAKLFTSKNIRNMATIGGTATGNFFVSDVLPVLAAFQVDIEYFQDGRKAVMPLVTWLRHKSGLICAILIKHTHRTVFFRQEKIAQMDFPLIVTALGVELNDGKISEPVIAISGAIGKLIVSESGAAVLSGKSPSEVTFEELNAAVQQEVEPTGNVKATPRVKRRVIESHLKAILAELQKEGA